MSCPQEAGHPGAQEHSHRGRAGTRQHPSNFFSYRWTDPGVPAPRDKWLPHPARDPGICEPDTDYQWNPQHPGGPTVFSNMTHQPHQRPGTWALPAFSPQHFLSYAILGPHPGTQPHLHADHRASISCHRAGGQVSSRKHEGSRGPRRPWPKPICNQRAGTRTRTQPLFCTK